MMVTVNVRLIKLASDGQKGQFPSLSIFKLVSSPPRCLFGKLHAFLALEKIIVGNSLKLTVPLSFYNVNRYIWFCAEAFNEYRARKFPFFCS